MGTTAHTSDRATVSPCSKPSGMFTVPGDKSISHRVGILASISSGISRVNGFLNSADCVGLLKAMESLGARTHLMRDGELYIHGTSGKIMEPAGSLDLGNSGTALRLLAGFLSGYDVSVVLTGDESLTQRPMRRIEEPLRRMGAHIELTGEKGCAPIRVTGGGLKGIHYEMPMASAQVKSCILLAALRAEGVTTVIEPQPTRDHTERIFKALGLPITVEDQTISVKGFGPSGPELQARAWDIPGDISSAAFWIVAAAAHRRGTLAIRHVGLNPRRTAVLDVLKRMGAKIKVYPKKKAAGEEPVGEVRVTGARLKSTVIEGAEIPNLIDEIPVLAVAAALAEGETVIKDAHELRVKESDRIRTMCDNLKRMNVDVEETEDGMRIRGPAHVRSEAIVDSYGDHRIAMAMAVLAMHSDAPLTIRGITCIETSYPGFWDDLTRVGGHVE